MRNDFFTHTLNDITNYTPGGDLSKEELWNLRQDVPVGSCYLRDYENSLNLDPDKVCDFFDGYLDYMDELAADFDNSESHMDFTDVLDMYDNPDTLYDYYCGIEYPFGMYEGSLHEDFLDHINKLARDVAPYESPETNKLKPGEFSHQKSFYNKAYVKTQYGVSTLYSYDTPVVSIVNGRIHLYPDWACSKTTLIHVKEFLAQKGFGILSVKDLRKLPVYPEGE